MSQAQPAAAAAFARAHARLLADPTFQFDFPVFTPPKPSAWWEWLSRLLKPLAPVMPWLFWGVVILGAGGLLVLAGRELLNPARRRGALKATVLQGGDLAPSRRRAAALLAEADRLAAEGRYGEAARVLLFRTLNDLEARRPGLIGPALTAREIAGLEALPGPVREPLAGVAATVERFLWAGRPLDRGDFAAARADYGRFLDAASAR